MKSPLTSEVYYSSGLPINLEEIIEYGQENQFPISLYLDGQVHTFNESMVKIHWELEKINARLIDKFVGNRELFKIIYANTPQKIMFEVAGLAIAMDNSPQEVKDAANFVTKSNNDDGVAYVLDRYINNVKV
ncbi:HAD hydrolase family protein [Peribacillus aracenensis]|uniref:HAD hydrolase family protein n=1 Tax=Peribacillus aracenensis TaxID=2976708 RepID=UPI0021A6BED6